MAELQITTSIMLPVFILLALGWLMRRIGLMSGDLPGRLNKLIFQLFLPVMLFDNVRSLTADTTPEWGFQLFILLGISAVWLIATLLVPRFEKDVRKRGVLVQGIMRANFVIFGLPVLLSLCGEDSNTGAVSLVIAVVVPLFNAFSVIALETNRGGKVRAGKVLKSVAANPLILSSLFGVLLLVLGVKLPSTLDKTLSDLAKTSTPLALVILGAEFDFKSVKGCLRPLIIGVTGRLVIVPAIFITAAVLLGFRGEELIALMIMLGAPPAVSSFTMAQQMDGDAELAGNMVVFGSLFAVLTIFMWIFVLKTLMLI